MPAPPPPAPGFNPLKIESANGSSIKLGLLLQPAYRAANTDGARTGTAQNLFIRRTRFLVGGTILGVIDYFFDTDAPNLGLSNNVASAAMPPVDSQVKAGSGMVVQDAFATFKAVGDAFKIDAGYMLPPMSHNAVQGAGTLLGLDYFTFTFRHTDAFGAAVPPVGRDVGVELRGLVLDNHLEYRAGLFQGLRRAQTATEVGSQNMFRFTARVQANLLDGEPGFFYGGTYLGKKSIASIGGSIDIQDKYKYFAGDAFVDLPAGPGVVTAQVNVAHWDGGTFIPALPKQTAIMAEAGYNFSPPGIGPIARFEHLDVNGAAPNTDRFGGGLAWWALGHTSNLKAFVTHSKTQQAPRSVNQFDLQWQLYFF